MCLITANSSIASAGNSNEAAIIRRHERLPTNIVPTHYDLTIMTDLEGLRFWGSGEINLTIVEETSTVAFNIHPSLILTSLALEFGGRTTQFPIAGQVQPGIEIMGSTIKDAGLERMVVTLPNDKVLTAGMLDVKLKATWEWGLDNKRMKGYYPCVFKNEQGQDRYYSITFFESTYARMAYPCWDEPSIHCTYDITMLSRNGLECLASMPKLMERSSDETDLWKSEREERGGHDAWKVVKFEKAPPMSSYLITWSNGPFAARKDSYVSPLTGKTIDLAVWATHELYDKTEFTLEVAKRGMVYFENLFGIPYALPKLDFLPLHDFPTGAEEGYGLISGNALWMICYADASIGSKQFVAHLVLHEIAHMWFGNLVSLEWWDELWLKESFASYCSDRLALDALFPEWRAGAMFLAETQLRAMRSDSLATTHSMQGKDAKTLVQIEAEYDEIPYFKGPAIIQMIAAMVSKDDFFDGVKHYLMRHKNGAANSKEFWEAIHQSSGVDVLSIAKDWIFDAGYPLITATMTSEGLKVSQTRYNTNPRSITSEFASCWTLPILRKDGFSEEITEMSATTEQTFSAPANSIWKLNRDNKGFYRVLYEPEHLERLGLEAKHNTGFLSTEDRIGLISDSFALVQSGHLKINVALDFLSHFENEEDVFVLEELSGHLSAILRLLWEQPESLQESFRSLLSKIAKPLTRRLGCDFHGDDSFEIKKLRTLALGLGAAARDPMILEWLRAQFKAAYLDNTTVVNSQIEHLVMGTGVDYGGEAEYNAARNLYDNSPDPKQREVGLYGMSATRQRHLLDKTLASLLHGIRAQDKPIVLYTMSSYKFDRRYKAQFCMDHFEELMETFKGNDAESLLNAPYAKFNDRAEAQAVIEFFKDKDQTQIAKPLAEMVEIVNRNANWLENNLEDLKDWLSVNGFTAKRSKGLEIKRSSHVS